FLPNGADRTGGVARVVEQRQISLRATAFSQLAADNHCGAVELGHWVVAHIRPARTFGGGQGFDAVVDADVGDRWLGRDMYLAAFGTGDKAQRLEVDQQ